MGNPLQSKPGAAGETPSAAGAVNPPPSSPWLARGVEDVYYQREAHIGWWTVLGGIALGALLTQVSSVIAEVQAGRWYLVLYVAASMLIIANAWVQTAWGALVVRWPISTEMALIHLFGGFALSIMSLQVPNPSGWMLATCGVILFSMLAQTYLVRSGAWAVFTPAYTARLQGAIWAQAAFGGVALAAGLLLLRYPGRLHETVWGVVGLPMAAVALWMQDRGMKVERAALGIP